MAEIVAGSVFVQTNIPFFVDTEWVRVGLGTDTRTEPKREFWQMGVRETQYGHEADGMGRFEIHLHEVVQSETSGPLAIYERRWFDPEGVQISKPRRKYSRLSSLKAIISKRKMVPVPKISEG